MRIVFLTGIWPPDVGGPATHGPDFAAFLRDRGHSVHVVTMGDSEPTERPVPVESIGRGRPFVVRYPLVAATGLRLARRADVVYATATYAAAAVAAIRRPLVAKLVSDPAYERARRYGAFDGPLEAFPASTGVQADLLKRLRTASLRRASRIVVPSRYLADIATGWGLDPARIEVLVNPAPPPQEIEPEPFGSSTFVFVGRLTEQKALTVALDAIAQVPGAQLVLVGDGPERERLEQHVAALGIGERVRFAGSRSRADVLRHLAGARAALLSSAWENLPHAAVEALSVGTPVISTSVGGVPEVVHDDENGLLVPAGDAGALADAIRRVLDDDALHARLAAGAQPSVEKIGREPTYTRLEQILAEAAPVTPRVLFVGRGRLALPLPPWLAKKWDALDETLDLRVLNAGSGGGDARFHLLPGAAQSFYPRLPLAVAHELRAFRPDAVVASDPYVAAGVLAGRSLARSGAKVIVEVHGDPRTFTRLYGSPARKSLSPLADAISTRSIRRADATRALSHFTSSLVEQARGIPATACFPTYSDLSAFADPPTVAVPHEERIAYVGALEPYKNVRGLAAAWRRVVAVRPDARLTIIGKGSQQAVVDELVQALPESVRHHAELPPDGVATALDESRSLVLPSWPEGLGRVVLESFARARTVVATDAGGIPDMVTHERNGILIPPGDTDALVDGLLRVLDEHELAERLGAAGHQAYARWHQTAEDFARAYRDLVDRVLAGAR